MKAAKDRSIPALAVKAVRRATRPFFYVGRSLLLERAMEQPNARELKNIEGFVLSNLRDDREFLQFAQEQFPRKYNVFKRRILAGLPGMGIYYEGKLVGHLFASCQDYYEPAHDYTIRLEPGDAYQFDGYIDPKYRLGLIPVIINKIFWTRLMAEFGSHRALALVDVANTTSLTFHSYMRFKETGRMLVIRYILGTPHSHETTYEHPFLRQRRAGATQSPS